MCTKPDRRAAILNAATHCFARFGYAKTTLDDIGRTVHLNKASLYYYFPNKDELFIAVVLREGEAFMQALAERVRELPTAAERVRSYLLERLRYYHQVLDYHQLSPIVLHGLEPRFEALYAEVLARETTFLADLLAPLLSQHAPPVATPQHLAHLLLSAADAIKHAASWPSPTAAQPDLGSAEADTRLLAELVLAGLTVLGADQPE